MTKARCSVDSECNIYHTHSSSGRNSLLSTLKISHDHAEFLPWLRWNPPVITLTHSISNQCLSALLSDPLVITGTIDNESLATMESYESVGSIWIASFEVLTSSCAWLRIQSKDCLKWRIQIFQSQTMVEKL